MAQVKSNSNLDNVKKEDLARYVSIALGDIVNQMNGGLEFKYNLMSSSLLTVTFSKINTDVQVNHDAGFIPKGFIVINPSAAMIIFKGILPWTQNTIFLQSNVVGTAALYVV